MSQNQCDGCHAGIPVDANGNHRMGAEGKYPDLMKCQADKYTDPADFASLLEREPAPEKVLRPSRCVSCGGECEWCDAHSTQPAPVDLSLEPIIKVNMERVHETAFEQTIRERDAAKATQASMAAHIKSLEGVLVAIRARVAKPVAYEQRAILALANEIVSLISETLDPCKPWCVLAEPGRKHEGCCIQAEDLADGE